MDFVQYRTGADDEERRLDKVLRILFPETPLSQFYGYLRKGLIRVNNAKVKQDYHIASGDIINVAAFLKLKSRTVPAAHTAKSGITVPCVFKNEHILVINKPYDMPVHETGSYKGMTLNQYVLETYPAKDGSLSFTPGPLHRLDRKTTGLITFSQSIEGARLFTELLKKHEIRKHYLSVVDGKLTEELTFSDMLTKEDDSPKAGFHKVKLSAEDGAKQAVTRVKPLAHGSLNGKNVTFVEVEIETGRTHQIRSQCAAHGYPLLGDSAYGGSPFECLFLHAYSLKILQPNALGLPKELFAPLSERFTAFVEKIFTTIAISQYNIVQ